MARSSREGAAVVACVGECMLELSSSLPRPQLGFAGDSLNLAVYMSRVDPSLDVEYVTRLGDDSFSDKMIAFIAAEKVGVARIARRRGRLPGLYAITVAEGERSFHYWRSEAPVRQMLAKPERALERFLSQADGLVATGISLAVLSPAARGRLIACARRNPSGMSYVLNHRPALWPLAQARAWHLKAASVASICIASDDDLARLWPDGSGLAKIMRRCPGEVVVTLGQAGCQIWRDGKQVAKASGRIRRTVDSTAAGDSFAARYIAGRLAGEEESASAKAACLLAGEVVSHHGAIIPRAAMPKGCAVRRKKS